jgi:hypothetical protein
MSTELKTNPTKWQVEGNFINQELEKLQNLSNFKTENAQLSLETIQFQGKTFNIVKMKYSKGGSS